MMNSYLFYYPNPVIKNENGNVMGIVCIGNNIVEIKEAKDKIKASLERKRIIT